MGKYAFLLSYKHGRLIRFPALQINTFPLTRPIDSLVELNDGQALWRVLRECNIPVPLLDCRANTNAIGEIDENSFEGELPIEKQAEQPRLQTRESLHQQTGLHFRYKRHINNYIVQYIYSRIQECLERRGRVYRDFTKVDLYNMVAEKSVPYVIKAGNSPARGSTARADSTE